MIGASLICIVPLLSTACTDPPPTASAVASTCASPLDGPALLAAVRDDSFNFDEPAFYWLIGRARLDAAAASAPAEPLPWRFLLERPSEYRGRCVVVEGFVQSCLGYEIIRDGAPYGRVWQTELAGAGTRGLCTLITVADAQPAAIGARVRVAAWFLKVRRFKTTAGEVSTAPLLVGHHLECVAGAQPLTEGMAARRGLGWARDGLILGTAVLAIVWFLLRRAQTARAPRWRR